MFNQLKTVIHTEPTTLRPTQNGGVIHWDHPEYQYEMRDKSLISTEWCQDLKTGWVIIDLTPINIPSYTIHLFKNLSDMSDCYLSLTQKVGARQILPHERIPIAPHMLDSFDLLNRT